MPYYDPNSLAALIQDSARRHGIDPATALRVAKSEGFSTYQGDTDATGTPTSFGPFQLHYAGHGNGMGGGGLGDAFTAQTGLDARDPSTIKQQIDFALDNAAKSGWSQWHGAAKVGIGSQDGIGAGAGAGTGSIGVGPGRFAPGLAGPGLNSGNAVAGSNLDPNGYGTGSIASAFGSPAPAEKPDAPPPAPSTDATPPPAPTDGGLGTVFAQALKGMAPSAAAAQPPQAKVTYQTPMVSSVPISSPLSRASAPIIA